MIPLLRETYRSSLKPQDSFFNVYLARPLATPVVLLAERAGLTPNQLTFSGLLAMLLALFSWLTPAVCGTELLASPQAVWLGLFWVEVAYVFDCADGQLARRTGQTSAVGAELDFLMDELKAYFLIAGLAVFWWQQNQDLHALLWGIFSLASLACALASTRFMRSEVVQSTGKVGVESHGASARTRSHGGSLKWALMPARFVTQYPQSLPLFILFDRIDLFVILYGVLHAVYTVGRVLQAVLRLSRV